MRVVVFLGGVVEFYYLCLKGLIDDVCLMGNEGLKDGVVSLLIWLILVCFVYLFSSNRL